MLVVQMAPLPSDAGPRGWASAMYVVPAARVLREIDRARGRAVTLHAEIELGGEVRPDWPTEIDVDLHPEYGIRIDDRRGGRWVIRRERVVAASRSELPVWLPQLEVLVVPPGEPLEIWLSGEGVDLQRNQLGRCGSVDCFVLGGRDGGSQLWVDKDTFDLRRWVSPAGRSFVFSAYQTWGRLRFPSEISVLDGDTALATLTVRTLVPAPELGERDFSRAWATP